MILPLGDSPNPRGVPVVNYLLLGANIAVYALISLPLSAQRPDPNDPMLMEYVRLIAERTSQSVGMRDVLQQITAYDLFVFEHGFRPADPSVIDLFFSMFLHGGFAHLFGNMLFLWIYGDNVEHRLGPVAYLFAYLGTGVAATLFHTLFALDSPLPLVGASGAISGVLGFYFLWFPRNQVRLLLFLFPFLMDVITVPARFLLGLYLIMDNLLPFLITRGAGSGVAHGAHIGGFLAGLAVAWVMNQWGERAAIPARPSGGAPRSGGDVRAAIASGDLENAAHLYFETPAGRSHRVLAPEEHLRLGGWLLRNGHVRPALSVYRRMIRDYPNDPHAAEAHFAAGLIQMQNLSQPVAAYQHFLDALDLDPGPELRTRIRAALDDIEARQKRAMRRFSRH